MAAGTLLPSEGAVSLPERLHHSPQAAPTASLGQRAGLRARLRAAACLLRPQAELLPRCEVSAPARELAAGGHAVDGCTHFEMRGR
jgi:hypothetical protein